MEVKKSRKPNWSGDELDALAQSVSEHIAVIRGKFSPSLTNAQKVKCWASITERVNSVNASGTQRDIVDVKKKWMDLSSLTKKKEALRVKQVRMTGGGNGPEDDLKSWEKVIIGSLSRASVEGVPGGVDTLENGAVAGTLNAGGDICISQSLSTGSTSGLDIENQNKLQPIGTDRDSFMMTSCTISSAFTEQDSVEGIKKKRKNSELNIPSRLLEIEEKKLKMAEETLQIKREKRDLQRRSTEAFETIALVLKQQEFTHTYFET